MSKLRHLVAGNWKMNGSHAMMAALLQELRAQAAALAADLLVCPPFPYLAPAAYQLKGSSIALGAQDCAPQESGAHTGDKDDACTMAALKNHPLQ